LKWKKRWGQLYPRSKEDFGLYFQNTEEGQRFAGKKLQLSDLHNDAESSRSSLAYWPVITVKKLSHNFHLNRSIEEIRLEGWGIGDILEKIWLGGRVVDELIEDNLPSGKVSIKPGDGVFYPPTQRHYR
jgi:hypothetical protein